MIEFDLTEVGNLASRVEDAVKQTLTSAEKVAIYDYVAMRDLRKEEKVEEEKQKALEKKNICFVQYSLPLGIEKLVELIEQNKQAAVLFLSIIKLMDRRNGLVASQKSLADMLLMDKAAISRSVKFLVEHEYLRKFDIGGATLFAINHRHVWRDSNDKRRFSLWDANILVDAQIHAEYVAKSAAVMFPRAPRKNKTGSKV